jgi:hypothetical protein
MGGQEGAGPQSWRYCCRAQAGQVLLGPVLESLILQAGSSSLEDFLAKFELGCRAHVGERGQGDLELLKSSVAND